jgi:uncharacterized protein
MSEDGPVTTIKPWLREILRCPACGSPLVDAESPAGVPELVCTECSRAYRSSGGIPVLLVDEARDASADPPADLPADGQADPPADGQADAPPDGQE